LTLIEHPLYQTLVKKLGEFPVKIDPLKDLNNQIVEQGLNPTLYLKTYWTGLADQSKLLQSRLNLFYCGMDLMTKSLETPAVARQIENSLESLGDLAYQIIRSKDPKPFKLFITLKPNKAHFYIKWNQQLEEKWSDFELGETRKRYVGLLLWIEQSLIQVLNPQNQR
jgi:hypothetical protein